MEITEFIKRFENVKSEGVNSYKCTCPTHSDKNPSLSVKQDGDKILLHCFAGCDTKNILGAIGLTEKDLFNNKSNNCSQPEVLEKEYFYADENGKTLYKVMRFNPKRFIQAQSCNGIWKFNMKGVRYVLYNLPNVVKSNTIYFVEGEKDADSLNSIGLVATTSIGGAQGFNKYKDNYIKFLEGKNVYIIPDNDNAGRKYAQDVHNSLVGIAKKVKILDLVNEIPDLKQKWDISDVLKEYNKDKTLEILENLKAKDFPMIKVFPIHTSDELTENNFEKILDYLGIKIRFNLITKRLEITGMPEKYAKSDLFTILPIYLKDVLRNHGISINNTRRIEEFISLEVAKNNYNPILDLLSQNEWDKTDRLEEVCSIFGLDDLFYRTLFKKWLMQSVAMLFNNLEHPFGAEGILVLHGKQGIGKSLALSSLISNPDWFADGVVIDMNNKDSIIKATSRWICELGELDDTLKKEQSALKAFITSPEDDIRPPYAKTSIRRARNTSYCASVNPLSFLKDSTGNRRFFVIHTDKIEWKKLRSLGKQWILQLWLQVYSEVKKDLNCFRLNEEEKELLRMNNLKFTEFLPFEEELLSMIDFQAKDLELWSNKELISNFFPTATAQLLGRSINKIADNYPDSVKISRTSKGVTYRMKIKDEYKKKSN